MRNGSPNCRRPGVLIVADHWQHFFKEDHAGNLEDIRRKGISYAGYLVTFRNGHACVRLEQEEYKWLKSYFVDHAVRRRRETLEAMFRRVPVAAYAPVRRQLLNILAAVNAERKLAGFELVPRSCLPFRSPRSVHVFVEGDERDAA